MPLVPKPPPTSGGAITRTRSSGTPSWPAITPRWRCTICTAPHTVSESPSQRATRPRGSSGCAPPRDSRTRVFTTTGAEASAAAASPTCCRHSATTLLPTSSCTTVAPAAIAASTSTTAGSASYSTRIRSSASCARYGSSATTTATASPTNRTRSRASDRDTARNGQRGMRRIDRHRLPRGPQIRRHEDPDHPGRPPRGRHVDRDDARMRMRRAQHRRVQAARHAQIIDELPPPP